MLSNLDPTKIKSPLFITWQNDFIIRQCGVKHRDLPRGKKLNCIAELIVVLPFYRILCAEAIRALFIILFL